MIMPTIKEIEKEKDKRPNIEGGRHEEVGEEVFGPAFFYDKIIDNGLECGEF